MYFEPACIPCIITQAYTMAKIVTNGDKEIQLGIIKEVSKKIENVNNSFSAPHFSVTLQSVLEKFSGSTNPFEKIKEENLTLASKFIPYLNMLVDNSEDKIEMALRVAIAGNIIDLAAKPDFDVKEEVKKITSDIIELPALQDFKESLLNSKMILYIADNYEEALFDKILLKQLTGKEVIFAVRSKSIFNDITREDAYQLGIDEICSVIESGSMIAGTDLKEVNQLFSEYYEKADLIIAKGQGNFETLHNSHKPVFFLFKVKCEVIAQRSGFPVGKGVLFLY